jgi:hypothetical protein
MAPEGHDAPDNLTTKISEIFRADMTAADARAFRIGGPANRAQQRRHANSGAERKKYDRRAKWD